MVTYSHEPAARSLPGDARALLAAVVGHRWANLFLTCVFPACFFTLVIMARAAHLAQHLQAGAGDASFVAFSAFVLQQTLTIGFLSVAVVLFVVRRPVVGRRSSLLGGIVALAGSFILTAAGGARVDEGQTAVLLVSSALVLAGAGFSIVSLLALGRCFGIMPEVRGLVTHGPYRWIRHPVYLGEIVAALGLALAAASPAILGLFVVFCGLQYWRTVLEERVLAEAFPEYAEYRRRTYRLLPWAR